MPSHVLQEEIQTEMKLKREGLKPIQSETEPKIEVTNNGYDEK